MLSKVCFLFVLFALNLSQKVYSLSLLSFVSKRKISRPPVYDANDVIVNDDPINSPGTNFHPLRNFILPILVPLSLVLSPAAPTFASDYGSLTAPQKKVSEAWRIIDSTFYDRSFNNKDWFFLRENAISDAKKFKSFDDSYDLLEEMVAKLDDKYTVILRPEQYSRIYKSTTGSNKDGVVGIGVELRNIDGDVVINDVEADAPADKANVKRNDVILQVGETDVSHYCNAVDKSSECVMNVATLLRGDEGSEITINVRRNANQVPISIKRKPFQVQNVRSYVSPSMIKGKKTGVVRIKSFSSLTSSEVKKEVEFMIGEKNIDNLVIDLRGNPGGLLPGGVDTAALFLPINSPTVTVYTRKLTDVQKTYSDGPFLSIPLAVLVDSSTASASEVMTAALSDNKRAFVVGGRTFGKGVIQTIRAMRENDIEGADAGGVKVTVARYETPNGTDINKKGILPAYDIGDCRESDAVMCLPPKFDFE